MTDRELLEAAAKAAWIEGRYMERGNDGPGIYQPLSDVEADAVWNPLTDDGDALRLAVSTGLVVDCSRPSAGPPFYSHTSSEVGCADLNAATRRAIVRAAASLGERGKT